jgi:hypothetical protein
MITVFDYQKIKQPAKICTLSDKSLTGMKFTGKESGNSIFLPAAGSRLHGDGMLNDVGEYGGYWGRTSNSSGGTYGFGTGDQGTVALSAVLTLTVAECAILW